MSRPFLMNGALAIGMTPGFVGLYGLFRPEAVLQFVEFPLPTTPESKALSAAQTRLHMLRNVSVSFLLTVIWSTGDEKLMGTAMGATLFLVAGDGIISKSFTGGGEWKHWSFAPVIAGITAALFGYF